jgi:hypothetical protein
VDSQGTTQTTGGWRPATRRCPPVALPLAIVVGSDGLGRTFVGARLGFNRHHHLPKLSLELCPFVQNRDTVAAHIVLVGRQSAER